MASFDDLGGALHDDAAANAPRASAIDVDAVIRAARARRRPRQWGAGALSVVAVLGIGGLAVSAWAPPVLIAASESAGDEQQLLSQERATDDSDVNAPFSVDEAQRAVDVLGCGALAPAASSTPTGLTLELRLPPTTPAGAEAIEGIALLSNTGITSVTVLTSTEASGVLAREGIVVSQGAVIGSVGLTLQLAAGESREVPVRIATADCGSASGGALAAGDYAVIGLIEVAGSATETSAFVVAPATTVRLN